MSNATHLPAAILREYDIRGTYGQTLFDNTAYEIGLRFGTVMHQNDLQTIAVARDGRLSSPCLSRELMQGLRDAGVNVIDVGIGPTPMLYFAVKHLKTHAGIMVTGSHNPGDDNGFKMLFHNRPFFGPDIKALGAVIPVIAAKLGTYQEESVSKHYIKRLLEDALPHLPLKVVWDTGNGAAGDIMQKLIQKLDGTHYLLNAPIDGTFPNHHPDPSEPHNLEQLIDKVHEVGADVGIAFDGDADRIGVVDGQGRMLFGDQLMVLFARDVLRDNPGATIIADVKASQFLFDDITAHGGQALMGRTGHSLIKVKMAETGAKLAGEMSGHVFFADRYYGYDDAIYAAIRLLNILSQESLSAFIDSLPKLYNTPEIRIPSTDETKFQIIDAIKEKLIQSEANVNTVDGVRISTADGWWLLRASNTQPVLVTRFESTSAEGLQGLKEHFTAVTDIQL